jgi:predicted small lipoprotein YifL
VRTALLLAALALTVAGCGRKPAPAAAPGPSRSTAGVEQPATAGRDAAGTPARGPRHLNGVPPGHYPKPGECRLWFPGRPPGQQPRATACASLRGNVPAGAFVLYGGKAYDADYDWAGEARRERGSVPDVVLDVLRGRR